MEELFLLRLCRTFYSLQLFSGALFTHLFEKIFGPIAIGVGIYAVMIAICWLLDNRDRGKRFYHIQDLYSKYASRKFQKIGTVYTSLNNFIP